jgi:putative transposase
MGVGNASGWRPTARVPLQRPTEADQVWTMDFTQDALASGRKFRTLNLMDGYTREALAIEADTPLFRHPSLESLMRRVSEIEVGWPR